MSKADPEEVSVVVERDGIRVEKTFEPEDFPVPAIAFAISSERDEPVDVRLVDQVPDEIPAEDIGFHPKYGAEFWSVEGETIVFEREFEAGEEYTTVYGLRARDTDQVERFLGEPDLERVDPEREDSSQAVRDVIGDLDLDDETDDDTDTEADTDEEPVEPLNLDDPTETSVSSESSSDGLEAAVSAVEPETESETEAEAPNGEAEPAIVDVSGDRVPPEDVASALAAELREGQVAESDLRALREALDVEPGGSDRARIQRIQQDVSDLRAYTDALEAFLDEQGEAQTLLRELRDEIDGLEERIRTVDTRVDTVADHAENAADRADELDAELDDVAASVDELDDEVTDLDEELAETSGTVEEMEERVAAIEDGLGDVDAVDERLADIEEDLEGLRSVEDRMEELDERLEEAHADLQELARMRDQLSSVFGAGQTGDEGGAGETDAGDGE